MEPDVVPLVNAAEIGLISEQFQLEHLIGQGAQSIVFLGRDLILARPVAVKVFLSKRFQTYKNAESPDSEAELDEDAERFLRGTRTMATLNHENVVRVLASGFSSGGYPYCVMDFCSGESLAVILKNGPMDQEMFAKTFLPVLDGLEHLHSHGVVHRDLKPENIVVSINDDGRVLPVIIDFGIAKWDKNLVEVSTNTVTEPNTILGTPNYMSPEQCASMAVGPASDIYSLGCVMHEALSGAPPFSSESSIDVMYKHRNQMPEKLKLKGARGQELANLLHSCLLKDPSARPSATELRNSLANVIAHEDFSIEKNDTNKRRVVLCALIAIISVVSLLALWSSHNQRPSAGKSGSEKLIGASISQRNLDKNPRIFDEITVIENGIDKVSKRKRLSFDTRVEAAEVLENDLTALLSMFVDANERAKIDHYRDAVLGAVTGLRNEVINASALEQELKHEYVSRIDSTRFFILDSRGSDSTSGRSSHTIQEAENDLLTARAICLRIWGKKSRMDAESLHRMTRLRIAQNKPQLALKLLEEAFDGWEFYDYHDREARIRQKLSNTVESTGAAHDRLAESCTSCLQMWQNSDTSKQSDYARLILKISEGFIRCNYFDDASGALTTAQTIIDDKRNSLSFPPPIKSELAQRISDLREKCSQARLSAKAK